MTSTGKFGVYPAAVMLVACPKCSAIVGDYCTRQYGGKVVPRGAHLARIQESKPKSPTPRLRSR